MDFVPILGQNLNYGYRVIIIIVETIYDTQPEAIERDTITINCQARHPLAHAFVNSLSCSRYHE